MALPSQTERSGDSGRAVSYQTSGGGASRAPLLIVGLLVVAGATAGIYFLSNASTGPKTVKAETPKAGDKPAGLLAKKPEIRPTEPKTVPVVANPPPQEPVRISLDSDQPATTPGTTPAPTPGPTATPTTPPTVTPAGESGKPTGIDVTNPNGLPNPSGNNPQGVNPNGTGGGDKTPGSPPAPNGQGGPNSPLPATGSTSDVMSMMAEGDRKQKAGDLLGARVLLSKALLSPKTSKGDQETLRGKLTTINQDLLFSTKVTAGDPMSEEYVIEAGDGLERVARKRALVTDWRLIERINKVDSSKLRIGKKLKLVRGPFHAVVSKSDFRLDLYWGVPSDPENWLFVKSFKVGIGQNTPVGDFTVKTASRQVNPPWTNPVTGEKFEADDPKNPIGERWVGIEGKGDAAKHKGFGIHGTVEPDSIGQSKSMGCVRMLADDVAMVYEMLMDPVSVVKLVP